MLNYASIANLEKFSRVFGAGYVVDNEQKYSSKTIYWPIRTWRPTSGQTLTVATAAGAQALGHSCCVVSVEGARIHAGDCSASRWNKQGPLFQCVKTCVEQSSTCVESCTHCPGASSQARNNYPTHSTTLPFKTCRR